MLHHETEDYFIPLPSYLASIKVAVPPAAIFLATYVFAFLTGAALTDAPRAVISFARNRFFQSPVMMVTAVVLSSIFLGYCSWVLAKSTPPAYEKIVALLLGGSSDSLTIVRDRITSIRATDPELAARLTKVVEVFSERNAVNAGQKSLSGERARIFVRALEADAEGDWGEHPLRAHALAEAYSMFGQSVAQSASLVSSTAAQEIRTPFKRAIDLYNRVASSGSPLAPTALHISALVNIGNANYYMKDYAGALAAWRNATSVGEHPNLSPWSNVVAALVMLDRPKEAIDEGERARTWAESSGRALVETYPYAGVLENMAFAKMQIEDYAGALSDIATANAFREDELTRQNLALALIIAKRFADAQQILRKIGPPLDVRSTPDDKVARCVYFIWALALHDSEPPIRAANMAAFLGERHSPEELSGTTTDGLEQLLRKVTTALPMSDLPCGSLGKIKAIMSLLPAS
jgi:tetratricopeptide (TPR) repeat protein